MTSEKSSRHPREQLSDALSHPVRFSITAAVAATEEIEFSAVREYIQVSDSVLSRQASQLEDANILHIRKGFVGKKPRTWYSLTKEGRAIWNQHLAALQAIASGAAPQQD
ncbi:winged helix-turn-helix domain-containing protein [Neomicrococcus aestuarii]|uniref:ArsR family transcriptional regulator n=1 Tax=Neomicrococcus aestuarii TaxID=556325 RepID=A0A1L2ZP98_9MICC|nr:transcriptional regulator [Neomicrococcus aestuarii]APF41253.1 ArsR family transcriptional regulator [Neomicrococcus aestuarii]